VEIRSALEGVVCLCTTLCTRIGGPELGGKIGPITRARMSRCGSQTRAPPGVGRCGGYGRGELGGRGDGGRWSWRWKGESCLVSFQNFSVFIVVCLVCQAQHVT
jgi:hypothetical protein